MKDKRNGAAEKLLSLAETMITALFAVCLIFTYFLRMTAITGNSMETTLSEGDRVVMSAWYGVPKQGDVVVINARHAVTLDPDSGETVESRGMGMYIVKRIIAVEGQRVDIDFQRGIVYVDDKVYDEPYISGLTHLDEGAFSGNYPVTVPKGHVFVMGDNRRDSQDSRSSKLGFVPEDDIIGRVLLKIAPLKDFGFVN